MTDPRAERLARALAEAVQHPRGNTVTKRDIKTLEPYAAALVQAREALRGGSDMSEVVDARAAIDALLPEEKP